MVILRDSGPTQRHWVSLSHWLGSSGGAIVPKHRELCGVEWTSETPLLEWKTQYTRSIAEEEITARGFNTD